MRCRGPTEALSFRTAFGIGAGLCVGSQERGRRGVLGVARRQIGCHGTGLLCPYQEMRSRGPIEIQQGPTRSSRGSINAQ